MNVQHTLCLFRPARVLAWLLALLLATLTLASAQAQAPPATPDAVTLARADGTVTADWPAVAGATRYHVAYSTDGGASWHAPVDDSANVPTNRLTFSADNGKTYVVGVRAGNDDGWGDWTNSAPAGPYQQQPPAAVGSVNVTRTDGTVSANWNASDGAERYHVTYTTDNGASWSLAALEHQETSIAINNADNGKTYVVGVRAGNDDGWSGWRNSAAAGPYVPPAPPAITAIRGDGGDSATVSWTPYGGSDFQSYRVIVCDDSQYDGSSCSGTVFQSDAIYDVKATGPMTVTGLDVGTGYGVILQVWRDGGTLKVHATLPALVTPPSAPSGLSATVGDESITLTWDDPSDGSITGYEYNVNHNDTSTGNFSGWGPWQSIAGSGTGSVSHVIDGLTNGKEYRYRLRAVNAGGAGGIAPTAHPWYVSATPQGSPSAPTGITVSVDLNVMTVGWNAVPGADGYDVRTKTGSADWVVVASNVTGTTADITILEMPDYTGVRARAGNAASAWTDVSRLPPPDIFDQPPGGMGAQSARAEAQNTLAAPTNVSVERLNGSGDDRIDLYDDESLIVKWDAVTGATGYRIACNYFEGDWNWHRSWRKCGKDGSNWKTYGTSAGTNGVTVNYIDGLVDSNTGSWTRIYIASSHSVIVQAVKDGTPGNWSAPFDTYPAYPIYLVQGDGVPPEYQRLDASSRTATGFTLAWTHPYRAAGHVAECVETVNGDPSGSWKKCSEDTNVFSEKMVDSKAVTTAQAHLYGLTINDRIVTGVTIDDLDLATAGKQSFDSWKSYDVRVSTLNPSGQSAHTYPSASVLEPYHNLAASNVTSTGATLSITNYAQGWWYKRTSPSGDSTCHAVSASPYTASLSSLTPGMPYTYKMYDQSGCNDADEKDSVSFTTPKPAASEVTATTAALSLSNWSTAWWYKSSESNASCTSVAAGTTTVNLGTLTAGTSYTYTTYGKDGCNSADAIGSATFTTPPLAKGRDAGRDFDTLVAASNDTPSGIWSNGTTMWVADYSDAKLYAYKMSDKSRDAAKDFNTLAAAGNGNPHGLWSDGTTMRVSDWTDDKLYAYKMSDKSRDATKDFDTLSAAGNDGPQGLWSDGTTMWVVDNTDDKLYAYKMSDRSRDAGKDFGTLKAAGNDNPTYIWSDGTTMWVADYSDAKIYAYKMSDKSRDAGKDFNTLAAAGNGNPHGLWSDGATMWVADYVDDKIYAYQMPPRLTASSVTTTTATLTLANPTGNWYYQADSGPDSTCQGPVSGASKALTGLTGSTTYTYTAYSKSGCNSADEIETVTFPTHGLAAGSLTPTGATLTLTGHTGNWWLKQTSPSTGTCTAGEADFSHALSTLTVGTTYTYTAYSKSGCNSADEIDTVTFTMPGLAAGSLTPTGATLTLTGHTGNWWLKQTSPSTGTCTAGEADFSHALSSLTAGTSYTYTAYRDSTCATLIYTVTFTPVHSPGERYVAKDFNTLSAAGNHSPRGLYSDGTTMWVVDRDDKKIYAYKRSDTSRDAAKDFNTLDAAGNDNPSGVWSDGTTMWVADRDDDKLYAYKRSDMSRDSAKDFNTLSAAGNQDPYLLWSDGTTMWVVDFIDGKLYAYKMSDRSRDATKDFDTLKAAGNDRPTGLWSDGTTTWVGDWDDDKIYAYKMSDRSRDAGKDFDTLHAAGNYHGTGLWSDGTTLWVADMGNAKLYAYQMPPRLTASSVTGTTATLTFTGHTGNWYYQADSGPDSTCQGPVSGASKALTGLTGGTTYTYTAYSKSGCNSADEIDTVTFTTVGLTAGSFTLTGATLTLTGHTGNWWLKQTSPSTGTCTAGEADFSHALDTLTGGTSYTYTAYSKSGCDSADEIGSVTFTTVGLAAGSLTPTGATLTLTGRTGNWWLKETSPSAGTCTAGETDFSHALSSLTRGTTYTYTAYSDSSCTTLVVAVTFTTPGLTAGSLTLTSATLTLTGRTGNWWLKETSPSTGTCTAGEADFSHALSSLTGGKTYTYTAYSDNSCATVIDTATFTILPAPKGRYTAKDFTTLKAAGNTFPYGIWSNGTTMWVVDRYDKKLYAYKLSDMSRDSAKDFNTLDAAGNDNPSGLWSDGTTMWVSDWIDDKLYAYKMSDRSRDAAKDLDHVHNPVGNNEHGIWSDGVTMWVVDYVNSKIYAYKLSDMSRDAAKDFNTLDAAGNDNPIDLWSDGVTMWVADNTDGKIYAYKMSDKSRDSSKDFNTLDASNDYVYGLWSDGATMWVGDWYDGKLYAYQGLPRLTTSGLATTTATLALANHMGTWYYKADSGPDSTCQGPVDGTSKALSGLTSVTPYVYTAYDKSGCGSADEIAEVTFTTHGLAAGSLTDTTATLTLTGHTGTWWLKETSPSTGTCTAGEADFSHALSSLDGGTTYTYTAYSNSTCTTLIDTATFTTPNLTAGSLILTGATLTLTGQTGNWWLKQTSPSTGTCTAGEADFSHALSSLDGGTTYAYTAYRDSTCTTLIATVTFTTQGLAAGSLTLTGATLTLTGRTGNWWLKETSPSEGTCTAGEADFSHALSTLTSGRTYTYTAYSNSSCSTLIDTVTFTTLGLTAGSVTTTTATLTLTGQTGNWWLKQTSPSEGTCTAGEADFSHALSTLTSGTPYTYTAYSNSSCSTVIDTVTFTTILPPPKGRYVAKDFNTLNAANNNDIAGLWSNGVTMWVVDYTDGKIYAYKMSDRSRDAAKDFDTLSAAGNGNPHGLWSNGTTMWVSDWIDDKLYAYKMSDKSRDATKDFGTLQAAGNEGPQGLWSDGTTMWVADYTDGKIYAYKMSDRSRDAGKDFNTLHAAGNDGPTYIWSDGVTMWVADYTDGKIYAYKMSDRSRDAGKDFDTLKAAGNDGPHGLWSNGATMWVADWVDDKLYAYQMPTRLTASSITATTATLTLANHTGAWWYKRTAGTPADSTCHNVASGTATASLASLTAGTTYTYTAYSKTNCASADALTSVTFSTLVSGGSVGSSAASAASGPYTAGVGTGGAAPRQGGEHPDSRPRSGRGQAIGGGDGTTTPAAASGRRAGNAADASAAPPTGYVTNLASAQSGDSDVDAAQRQAVAFTTGPNPGGYVLKSFTAALRKLGGDGDLVLTLHETAEGGQPSAMVLATLAGAAPASGAYTDVTYTCSGSGCRLAPDTTYFVVAEAVGAGAYAWAYAAASNLYSETTEPEGSGWTLGTGRYADDNGDWTSWDDWHHARIDFEAPPSPAVTVSNLDRPVHDDACFPSGDVACAVGFTTGPHPDGYTLDAVTARFAAADDPDGLLGDIAVTLHADGGGVPGALLATLSGRNPRASGDYAYVCFGLESCVLSPNTTYFVQITAAAGEYLSEAYEWAATLSDHETQSPAGNGWRLADGTDGYESAWVEYRDVGLLRVRATAR